MSFGQLVAEPSPLVVGRIGEIAVVCVLIWFAVHILYERGLLGPWPPSRRSVRIGVWLFLLYPLIGPLGFAMLVLLFGVMLPVVECTAILIVDSLFFSEDLYFILAVSLGYFKILRWCWRGYGAAGVTVVLSVSFSASVILASLGLTYNAVYVGLEFADTGWGIVLFYAICLGRDALKPMTKTEPEMFVLVGHSPIEVAMRSMYGVMVPLVHRIRVDRDESALAMLKSVLCIGSGLEKSLSLACKALGFDRRDLISAADTESASVVLQNVSAKWGNLSRIELFILLVLSGAWIVVIASAVWVFLSGAFFRDFALSFVLLFAFVCLPLGMMGLVSNRSTKPGMDYDLGKRHDEHFRFSQREIDERRVFDVLVVVAALAGVTGVTLVALASGVLLSGLLVLVPLSVVYILAAVLLVFDPFVRGRRPSPEATLESIRKRLLERAPRTNKETTDFD